MRKRPSIAGAIREAAQPSASPVPVEIRPETPATAPEVPRRPFQAKTREGKKMIAAPIDPAARQQLKMLAAELDRKSEDLIREALRDLFSKYGKPPIA